MFGRRRVRAGVCAEAGKPAVELLEDRRLLSASAWQAVPGVVMKPADGATVSGYTPSQIRKAYGFDTISETGAGQTIAIVDAYDDPNIQNDLSAFDAQFGIAAPPSFSVISQRGLTTDLPTSDQGWAGEISLDVEWAHAVAPQANIVLVEADSASNADLLAAVDYARNFVPGVSVVSMSWGGSEFHQFPDDPNYDQLADDYHFLTPNGHQGITYVVSAGDSSSAVGAQWPSASPNVLSVGGTALTFADSGGTYGGEKTWSGTNGGYSLYETEPDYQQGAQNRGGRGVPDVSYNADPNTGFAVYDTFGFDGWMSVGGTSAGAPQWAALVALADQNRANLGLDSLDGRTGTLPILYSLYSAPGTPGYSNYTSYFNDVIDSNPNWGGWGFDAGGSVAGYDFVSGLGTPKAGPIINALSGPTPTSPPTPITSSPTPVPPYDPQVLPASQLTTTVMNNPPISVLGGTSTSLRVKVENTSTSAFSGPVSITVYASQDSALSSDDAVLKTVELKRVNLKSGGKRMVTIRFNEPATGSNVAYSLLASATAVGTNTAVANSVAPSPILVTAATTDLAVSFAGGNPISVTPGASQTALLTIQNLGTVAARGTFSLKLYTSDDQTLDGTDAVLVTVPTRHISIGAGKSITLRVRFAAPADRAAGSYYVIASAQSALTVADTNPANDVAVAGT